MELTNEQWNRIEPVISSLTPKKDPRGRRPRDPRDVMNGILWILRTGAPWKDLPQRYPPYQTCHRRFQQWVRQGVFERIVKELAEDLYERGGIRRQMPLRIVHYNENASSLYLRQPRQSLKLGLNYPVAELQPSCNERHRSHPCRSAADWSVG